MKPLRLIVLNGIAVSALFPLVTRAEMIRIHQGDLVSSPKIEGRISTREGTQIPGDSDLKTCWIYGNLFIHLKSGKTLYKSLYAHGENATRIPVYASHVDASEPDCDRALSNLNDREARYSEAYLSDVYLNSPEEFSTDRTTGRKFKYVLDVGADENGQIRSEELKRIY